MELSSKLYEYQAAGKPVICCSSGQPGRYVSETKSGTVVRPGDYEALARGVLCLKENPGVAEKLGLLEGDMLKQPVNREDRLKDDDGSQQCTQGFFWIHKAEQQVA